jgi:hypothetical protein
MWEQRNVPIASLKEFRSFGNAPAPDTDEIHAHLFV